MKTTYHIIISESHGGDLVRNGQNFLTHQGKSSILSAIFTEMRRYPCELAGRTLVRATSQNNLHYAYNEIVGIWEPGLFKSWVSALKALIRV